MLYLFNLLLLISFQGESGSPTHAPLLEISFCRPDVPEVIRRGRADFNAIYTFSVGAGNRPVDIQKLRDPYVGEEKIRACIEEWSLPGLRIGSKITVALQWRHGVGWLSMNIVGEQINQRIMLSGKSCPYGKDPGR